MEHTKNPKIAAEIAMDHLSENPFYYDDLSKIEKEGAITEMPHIQLSDSVLDLNIEKYNLSQQEKQRLMQAFHQGAGILAQMKDGTYVVINKNGIHKASHDDIQKLSSSSLPKDWEKYISRVPD